MNFQAQFDFYKQQVEEALAAAEKLGYPVLLRPSYVIGGQMAFVSSTIPGEYMPAYIVNKLLSGLVAAGVAIALVKPEKAGELVILQPEETRASA